MQVYDNKVDVWSAGLIFAEILVRKPLLQGKNYMHQLKLIVRLLGRPTEEELSCLAHKKAKEAIRELHYPGMPFEECFRVCQNPLVRACACARARARARFFLGGGVSCVRLDVCVRVCLACRVCDWMCVCGCVPVLTCCDVCAWMDACVVCVDDR